MKIKPARGRLTRSGAAPRDTPAGAALAKAFKVQGDERKPSSARKAAKASRPPFALLRAIEEKPSSARKASGGSLLPANLAGQLYHLKERPKHLPSGKALLALIEKNTLTVRVLEEEERAALKPQFLGGTGLTEAEEEALRSGGVRSAELAVGGALWALAHHDSEAKYLALVRGSLTVERAARQLGVNESRVRQLLGETRLYGIKQGGGWRLPAFQFLGKRRGVVPGIDRVLPRLPRDLGLLAAYRWFTTPTPDLCHEDEDPLSPLEWLRQGRSTEPVAALAAEL